MLHRQGTFEERAGRRNFSDTRKESYSAGGTPGLIALLPRNRFGSGIGAGLADMGGVDSIFGSVEGAMGLGEEGIGTGAGATPVGVDRGMGAGKALVISAGLEGVITAVRFLGDFGS